MNWSAAPNPHESYHDKMQPVRRNNKLQRGFFCPSVCGTHRVHESKSDNDTDDVTPKATTTSEKARGASIRRRPQWSVTHSGMAAATSACGRRPVES